MAWARSWDLPSSVCASCFSSQCSLCQPNQAGSLILGKGRFNYRSTFHCIISLAHARGVDCTSPPHHLNWRSSYVRSVQENHGQSARRVFLKGFWRPQAWPCLSHLDDHLALGTSCFDVSQRLFGRCEGKDPIHNWADDPSINERPDLA